MRYVTLTAEVTESELSKQKLRHSGVVKMGKDGQPVKPGIVLYTGNCLVAEDSDFETIEAVQALDQTLQAELGLLKRKVGEPAADDDEPKYKGLVYCLNNSGLRLNYRDKILTPFKVSADNFMTAMTWASTQPDGSPARTLLSQLGTDFEGTKTKVIEMYKAAQA